MWRSSRALETGLAEKKIFDLQPVVDAAKLILDVEVGGRSEEDALATEAPELAWVVVDQEVGGENTFVAAEDNIRGWDKGEVALQPGELGGKGGGDLHGGGADKELEVLG